jgi:DivIVA domain-containing protein
MRNKEKDTDGAEPFAPPPGMSGTPKPISPLEIQQKEFRYARFGGYKMRDVDEFLDRVTEAMSAVVAENERLRAGVAPAPPVLGTPDLDDVGRQADEIIQRARDEASRIVAAARASALSVDAVAGATVDATEDERAAINAFLTREKEFLQSLAGLVQGHAGSVKEMAKAARTRGVTLSASTPSAPRPAPLARSVPPRPAASPTRPETQASPTTATPAGASPVPARPAAVPTPPETTISLPRAEEEPLRMEEPAAATARRDAGDDEAREAGDSSLRELFWGEE